MKYHPILLPVMRLVPALLLAAVTISGTVLAESASSTTARERTLFNDGWRFHRGDAPDLKPGDLAATKLRDYLLPTGNEVAGTNTVVRPEGDPGAGISFVQPSFDDSSWRKLTLPHDWAIEGPFDIAARGVTGKLPYWGQGWYRKTFDLPSSDAGRRINLGIDGAMSHSMIWVNGHFAGGWPYGYSSYSVDITPWLHVGGSNTVAIRLDNPQDLSRWYPGAGIYRNVWLTKTSPVHVAHWGTGVTTPEVSPEKATVRIATTLANDGQSPAKAVLSTKIVPIDTTGRSTGSEITLPPVSGTINPGGDLRLEQTGTVTQPRLWDTEHPDRYAAVTTVSVDGKLVDRVETPFGIRTARFDAQNGFLLNGRRVTLNGVCNHHDLGALGAAFNTSAAERQLRILKEMGVNALRTSHNMPAPELLDLCDRMGILVMDESFDCWRKLKTLGDYHNEFDDWHERDLRALIRRDRNHPSVIMWSLGNEIPEQGSKEAVPLVSELVRIAHEEDPTRPASAGGNGVSDWDPSFAEAYDLLGQNYYSVFYPAIRKKNPLKPLFGSETASCVSSRGEYFFQTPEGMEAFNAQLRKEQEQRYEQQLKWAQKEGKPAPPAPVFIAEEFTPVSRNTYRGGMENFQISSYDLYCPVWAQTPDEEFAELDKEPSVAGEFVWTGFDYLGEPMFYSDLTSLLNFGNEPAKQAEYEKQLKELGRVRCPSRSSYFGIVDLCGFPKDRFYLYQSRWRPDLPMVHILPHWNWPSRIGKVTPVHVYTSGDEAELFLNGKSQGFRSKGIGDGKIPNLALAGKASVSSEVTGNVAGNALDGKQSTVWVANGGSPDQWWIVDLGKECAVRQITLRHERSPERYGLTLQASDDGKTWRPVKGLSAPRYRVGMACYSCDDRFRHLRVDFPKFSPKDWASLAEVGIYGSEWTPNDTPYRLTWNDVVYQPGELKAVAYKDGKKWAEESIVTTGEPAAVKLEAERPSISGDGRDLVYVKARIVDEKGRTVPVACNPLRFEVEGGGELVATDNGDPTDLTTFSSSDRKAFNGLALAIVRAKPGESGTITLKASSKGLLGDQITIPVKKSEESSH